MYWRGNVYKNSIRKFLASKKFGILIFVGRKPHMARVGALGGAYVRRATPPPNDLGAELG